MGMTEHVADPVGDEIGSARSPALGAPSPRLELASGSRLRGAINAETWATRRGGAGRPNRARRREGDFASKGKDATHQKFAKMNSDVEKSENDLVVFGGENWHQHRISVRLSRDHVHVA
jgi:hypothetical protein